MRTCDEEDIAISAIHSFYRGLADQRFHSISGNNELWKILATIVYRKISKQKREQHAQKRGGGHVRGESFFTTDTAPATGTARAGIGNAAVSSHSPYLEVEFLDTCEKLYELLDDEATRNVARLTMEGYSPDDIAEKLGCVRRTVERKLKRIRDKWLQQEIK
jgi:DNA-directed RNA polymerase specialized sigma24 family protein